MERSSSGARIALGLAALALVIGLWLGQGSAPPGPTEAHTEAATPAAPHAASPLQPLELPEPHQRIEERGRLTLEASALPAEGTLSLALDLPDEARGDGPRPVVIASVDGRRLETSAAPRPGAASGVQIEIDPGWLEPGQYMISVSTAERLPLAVRRYVLEIR
jgi:hypothetical protein